jgi:lipoprotein-releasing system ATP-binding protein|tara:strand:+ start:11247 stop:11900 length:654 start_codon:yes stop_codon:yes gene_type:complete
LIELKGIKKNYGKLEILKGIDLTVKKGECISIVGSSGAGKSTLLQIIGTLDSANEGQLLIDNKDINKLNKDQLSSFRNKNIGFIFQFHNLLPEFSALENVCIPAFIAGMSQKDAEKSAFELLKRLKLEDRANHKPSQLSGGEQQRVAVARALINQPTILLADEPSGNLDSKNADDLHKLILEVNKEFNQTCIVVTHNNDFANMAHRKLTITDGLIEE